jgi:hypothetical protein
MTFGFILTRHVNSATSNKYWNQSVKLIRTFYPYAKIIIIDDNSDYSLVKADFNYVNVEVIQSEYPKRGELLPFIYYLRNKWFDKAVILHDSVFLSKKVNFDSIQLPVLPIWHAPYDKENISNLHRVSSLLKNNAHIQHILAKPKENVLSCVASRDPSDFNICFGVQCVIRHDFLIRIENKYKISNLIQGIHCRADRCSLERIMGAVFSEECPELCKRKSLFGSIHFHYKAFKYNYNEYEYDFKHNRPKGIMVKVWTGR